MLKVKTYIAPDSMGGTGLFAAQDIPVGTVVSRYDPQFSRYISVDEYFSLEGEELEHIQKFTYPDCSPHDDPATVGLILCLDNARFSNHSDTPNTWIYPNDLNASVACQTIKKGEEITCDYFQFDPQNVIHGYGLVSGKSFLLSPCALPNIKAG